MSPKGILKGGITCSQVTNESRYGCLIRFTPFGLAEAAGVGIRIGPRHVLAAAHCFARNWALDAVDVGSGDRFRVVSVHFDDLPDAYVYGMGPPLTEEFLTTPADRLAIAILDSDVATVEAKVAVLAADYRGEAGLAAGALRGGHLVPVAATCKVVDQHDGVALVNEETPCVNYGFSRGSGTPLIVPKDSDPLQITGVLSEIWRPDRVQGVPTTGGYLLVTEKRKRWIESILKGERPLSSRPSATEAPPANGFHITATNEDDHFPYPVFQWEDPLPDDTMEFHMMSGGGAVFYQYGAIVLEPVDSDTARASVYGPSTQGLGTLLGTMDMQVTSHPDASGRHWLKGSLSHQGDMVDIYLYCMEDDAAAPQYKRQIYMEAFIQGGSFEDDRPERGSLDIPPAVRAAPAAVQARRPSGVRGEYAQDDVGTGHERKPT